MRPSVLEVMMLDAAHAPRGDRSTLSFDELELLENKILPTARRWLGIPGLADKARSTLDYWGET